MAGYSYLAALAACLLVTAPLELLLRARVYRRPAKVLRALVPVVVVFVVWDLVGAARGHWWWDERFVTGVDVLGLPVEEWLFFIVVPLCALLTFESLDYPRRRRDRSPGATGHDATGHGEAGHGAGLGGSPSVDPGAPAVEPDRPSAARARAEQPTEAGER